MDKALKIILGLILVVVPLYLVLPGMPLAGWGAAAWELIKGAITIVVILVGLILIILGISELKD